MEITETQCGGPAGGCEVAAERKHPGRMGSTMDNATVLGYMVQYTQQDLARARGQRNWRTLFRGIGTSK
jgi:hypothetical protein